MFVLSFGLGYPFVTSLHMASFGAGVAMNLISLLTFVLLLMDDQAFKFWRENHKNVYYVIGVTQTLVTFKVARGLTCDLLNKKPFNCTFDDKFRTYVRPLFALSMVQTVV